MRHVCLLIVAYPPSDVQREVYPPIADWTVDSPAFTARSSSTNPYNILSSPPLQRDSVAWPQSIVPSRSWICKQFMATEDGWAGGIYPWQTRAAAEAFRMCGP